MSFNENFSRVVNWYESFKERAIYFAVAPLLLVPTPDPTIIDTAITNADLNVNTAFSWSTAFLQAGAGFVIVSAAIAIGVKLLRGMKRVAM